MLTSSGNRSQQRFSLEEVAKMDRLNAKKFKKPIKSGGNKSYYEEKPDITVDVSSTYRDRAAERRQAEKLQLSMPQQQISEVDHTFFARSIESKEKVSTNEEVCCPQTELGMKIYQLLNSTKTPSSQRKDHLLCQIYSFNVHHDNDNYIPNTMMKSRLELNDAEETLMSYVSPYILEQLSKRNQVQPKQPSNKPLPTLLKAPEKVKDLVGDIFEGLDKYVPDLDNQSSETLQVSMQNIFTHTRDEVSIIETVKSSAETSSLKSIAPTLLNQLHDEKNSGSFII